MHLLQLPSTVLLCLLLELPKGPPKALQLHLLHPQLSRPTPPLSLRKQGTYRACLRQPPPGAPAFPAPGLSAYLDLKSFCGVLGFLKPTLELHQSLCLLLWGRGGGGSALEPGANRGGVGGMPAALFQG